MESCTKKIINASPRIHYCRAELQMDFVLSASSNPWLTIPFAIVSTALAVYVLFITIPAKSGKGSMLSQRQKKIAMYLCIGLLVMVVGAVIISLGVGHTRNTMYNSGSFPTN